MNLKVFVKNISANSTTLAVAAISQITSIYYLLDWWGVNVYSDWLKLLSSASLFGFLDFGVVTYFSNKLIIIYNKDGLNAFNNLINSLFGFILFLFSLVLVVLVVFFNFLDLKSFLNISSLSRGEVDAVIFILIFHVFLGFLISIFDSCYNAIGLHARSVLYNNLSRILEIVLILSCVLSDLNFVSITLLYVIPRLLLLFLKILYAYHRFHFRLCVDIKNIRIIGKEVKFSIPFMIFPIVNWFTLQGQIVLVSKFYTSEVVVLFSLIRSFFNFLRTGFSVLNSSLTSEISILFGRKNQEKLAKMHRLLVLVTIIISMTLFIVLFIFGDMLFEIWVGEKLKLDHILFNLFLLNSVIGNLWFVSSVFLSATNNIRKFGVYSLFASFIFFLINILFVYFFRFLYVLPITLVILDLLLIIKFIPEVLRVLSDSPMEFITYLKKSLLYPRNTALIFIQEFKKNKIS